MLVNPAELIDKYFEANNVVLMHKVESRKGMDVWAVSLTTVEQTSEGLRENTELFEYSTGQGHRNRQGGEPVTPKIHEIVDCLLTDAECGKLGFEDFVIEYGYEHPAEGYRAWAGCQDTKRKLERLLKQNDIADLREALLEFNL